MTWSLLVSSQLKALELKKPGIAGRRSMWTVVAG